MKIGIEAERANHPQKTGVEHYAKQLILHLSKIDSINNYILYLRTPPEEWFLKLPKNFEVKVMPFPFFWTQIRISWEMLKKPVDVLLVPASAIPVIHPKKTFVVVHDMAWKYFPDSYTKGQLYFLQFFTWIAVTYCAGIIAVSEATKKDLLNFYNVKPAKISVVHHGYEKPQNLENPNIEKFSLPKKYILFLSTLQPRKNLSGLIDALRLLKTQHPEIIHKLVVVGKPGWKYQEILNKIQANSDLVIYLNYLSDQDRIEVIKQADLLVLPSFYEGFGMTILEAFSQGVPVAASNLSSMPEVAGDAAVYFDPKSINQIAQAIKTVIVDRSLHDRLAEKGQQRLTNFSWEKCAEKTLKVLTS